MITELTVLLATPIAKAILDKFYEGVGSKLGEKAVELLPEKVKQLGQLAWDKYVGKQPNAEAVLQKAAEGSIADQEKVTQLLYQALERDPDFFQQAQAIAQEIHLEINNDFGQMTQINRDHSTGYLTKTGPDNTNFFGGTHHHH